jgi:hypothetical protein
MYNPRPYRLTMAYFLKVIKKTVHEGAGPIPSTGMHHKPRLLIDHYKVVVLKYDVQRDWLR